MRILYVDVDSLRPDHLGCYGYHRNTSPNVDALAADGRRFTNCYTSDAPCLPSRTALFTGRFGVHTGVVNHGGVNAEPRPRGERRGFRPNDEYRTMTSALAAAGHRTALVSAFPQRHGAWHVLEGFDEWHDTGENGMEIADTVYDRADAWLRDHAAEGDWYLHVNFWDPHTPYRTPLEYGNPFEDDPAPEWLTADRIAAQRESTGPFSARDLYFYGEKYDGFPSVADERMPDEIASRADFRRFVDGYDVGVRYVDDYVGDLVDRLRAEGVFEETLIVVSADHGENLGELNVYGDHLTADEATCRVPLVVRGPGVEPGVDDALRYQLDVAPTLVELAGGDPAPRWDGRSFADAVGGDADDGRESLVLGHCAWTAQRAVRWDDWLLVRTYHDAYKDLDPVALFDLASDPHETTDVAPAEQRAVRRGVALLDEWRDRRLFEVATDRAGGNPDAPDAVTDPLWQVLAEGGPAHPRGNLADYLDRLRETGRADHASRLERTEGFVDPELPIGNGTD